MVPPETADGRKDRTIEMHHVLLVEDNPADVLLIREAMRTCQVPVDVAIAYDGEQATSNAGSQKFDLIILDLNVPKVDGHRLLAEKRLQDGSPLVVFTGSRKQADKEEALALGAKDYVVKPADLQEYMSVVRGILDLWVGGTDAVTASM